MLSQAALVSRAVRPALALSRTKASQRTSQRCMASADMSGLKLDKNTPEEVGPIARSAGGQAAPGLELLPACWGGRRGRAERRSGCALPCGQAPLGSAEPVLPCWPLPAAACFRCPVAPRNPHLPPPAAPPRHAPQTWKQVLSPEAFNILRNKGTEPAGSGEYNKFNKEGVYKCGGCGTPLYTSDTKFDSGCGWPAFYDEIPGAVDRHVDNAYGMRRVEITCANCGGHLVSGRAAPGRGGGEARSAPLLAHRAPSSPFPPTPCAGSRV